MLPPRISSEERVFYKAVLVLGKGIYKKRFISGEIPAFLNDAARTYHLKMVLWDCGEILRLKVLVYK